MQRFPPLLALAALLSTLDSEDPTRRRRLASLRSRQVAVKHRGGFAFTFGIVAIALCSSCVASLNPWFGTDVQVFEERLLGTWWDTVGDLYCRFKRGPDDTYVMILIAPDDNEKVRFNARLGNIEGFYYLDLVLQHTKPRFPIQEWWWVFGANWIVHVEFDEDKIRFNGMDSDRMKKMITAGRVRGAAIEGTALDGGIHFYHPETLMISSSTETLQQFLVAHGQDPDLWLEGEWFERM